MGTARISERKISLDSQESFFITAISDIHYESPLFKKEELARLMRERASLPHHRIVIIGDFFDLILPSDVKRFMPHALSSEFSGIDDIVGEMVASAARFLVSLGSPVDVIGIGNHEEEYKKRHHLDVGAMLVREYNRLCAETESLTSHTADLGGYSGVIDYLIERHNNYSRVRIVYHHGAWRGEVNSGLGRARQYFMTWPDWDIALFGHSHDPFVKPELRPRIVSGKNGKYITEVPCYIVNCGSWVGHSFDDANRVSYAERRGYQRKARTAPLFEVKQTRRRDGGVRYVENIIAVTI